MGIRLTKAGWTPALVAAVLLAGATDTYAQRKITRLGNPGTRLTAPIKDTAALQRIFTNKRNQTNVSRVLDKAGLTSITPQVISALTEGKVTATSVAPGTSLQWMGLRRGGRADIVTDAVWAGTKPFDGFAFTVEQGVKQYNFVVPKGCGNLTLLGVTDKPLPGCVNVAVARDCDTKQMTFSASGASITAKQVTKVTVLRDGTKVGEMLPGAGFKLALPVQAGRYTFMAMDEYGREFGTCERDLMVEACAASPDINPANGRDENFNDSKNAFSSPLSIVNSDMAVARGSRPPTLTRSPFSRTHSIDSQSIRS